MRLYHGSDNPKLIIQPAKNGFGYHPGASPVEFLGPSLSDNKDVASSYGKYVYELEFTLKKIKKYRSLNALRNNIIKTFGLPVSGQNIGKYYRDTADSYRTKLLAEGFDAFAFQEGMKHEITKNPANTIIPLLPPINTPSKHLSPPYSNQMTHAPKPRTSILKFLRI